MKFKTTVKVMLVVSVLVALTGCSRFGAARFNNDLKQLLPERQGFIWRYFGFAEYDHYMTLDTFQQTGGTTRYTISGEVGDPSGGEATRDLTLKITYTIQNGVWLQEKQEEAMMDSEFNRLEILRGPIEQGKGWTQKQKDKEGKERTLVSTIEAVRTEAGMRIVTVRYQDQSSPYYELREIKQGTGITMFEKLWISEHGNFEIGYSLFKTE